MGRKPIVPKPVSNRELFDHYEYSKRNRRDVCRVNILWDLLHPGDQPATREAIADRNSMSTRTIQRLVKLYNEQGFDAIVEHHYQRRGRKPKVSKPVWKETILPIIESLQNPEDRSFSAKKLHEILTNEHGMIIKLSTLIKTLHRNQIYPLAKRRKKRAPGGIFASEGSRRCCQDDYEPGAEPQLPKVEPVNINVPWRRYRKISAEDENPVTNTEMSPDYSLSVLEIGS